MSFTRFQLAEALDAFLAVQAFQDYCPNGLQVEGRLSLRKIVTGVTACQALIDAAIALKADALLVHHGYFWKGEAAVLTGIKGQRIKSLMQADMNLFAYHLPLDVHPQVGNNQQLAQHLGLEVTGALQQTPQGALGLLGRLPQPLPATDLKNLLSEKLGRSPLHLSGHERPIQKLAWCTGAAQEALPLAAQLGMDAYLSGEVSERTAHEARELGIDYFAIGHHASERYGIKALGEWISTQWGLEQVFIDVDNPV